MIAGSDSDRALPDHILECIEHAEEYTARGRDEFESSTMVRDATVRKLQVLAESTQRLSEEVKSSEPEIPWRQIAGFRNTQYVGSRLPRYRREIGLGCYRGRSAKIERSSFANACEAERICAS